MEKKTYTRRQVVLNFRSNKAPYFISIRALTKDNNITEQGLRMAVFEAKRNFEISNLRLDKFKVQYRGIEEVEVTANEDKKLNKGGVFIETFIGRNSTIFEYG